MDRWAIVLSDDRVEGNTLRCQNPLRPHWSTLKFRFYTDFWTAQLQKMSVLTGQMLRLVPAETSYILNPFSTVLAGTSRFVSLPDTSQCNSIWKTSLLKVFLCHFLVFRTYPKDRHTHSSALYSSTGLFCCEPFLCMRFFKTICSLSKFCLLFFCILG